jgi:hypothetical protein
VAQALILCFRVHLPDVVGCELLNDDRMHDLLRVFPASTARYESGTGLTSPEGAHAGWNLCRDGAGTMVPPGLAPGVQDGSAIRRGGVVTAGPHSAGTGTAAAPGDPVGVHDVRIARIDGQRLLLPVGRSAMALGPLDLFHVNPPSDRTAGGADVIDADQVCEPKVTKARLAGRHPKVATQVESSAAVRARDAVAFRAVAGGKDRAGWGYG